MRKTFKKLIIALLIIVLLNNFIISNTVFAVEDAVDNFIEATLKTVVGLFTWPIRILAMGIANAMYKLTASIAYCESPDQLTDSDGSLATISPFDIVFNKVKIVDINFFDVNDDDTIVMTIRRGIASWFYAMRLISAVILLGVLVYVGIRMAITTVASDRALYKKMLIDWVISVALLFLLTFIVVLVININSILVSTIEGVVISGSGSGQENTINHAIEEFGQLATKLGAINSISATVVYVLLSWQTLGLLITYFSRMLKLAFLLIISPLITLTYAIDKMGDGKAQALNAWLKEFVFTVLIQPFHCIIYAVLVNTAFTLLLRPDSTPNTKIAAGLIAVLCIRFVKEAEEILRKIFSFADDNKSTSLAAGAATAMIGMKYAAGAGKTAGMFAGKTVNFATNVARNYPQMVTNLGANLHAIRTIGEGSGRNFEERRDDYVEEHTTARAERDEQRLNELEQEEIDLKATESEKEAVRDKYFKMREETDKQIARLTVEKLRKDPSLRADVAEAQARAEVAKENLKIEKDNKFARDHKTISGFRTGGKKALTYAKNSDAAKLTGSFIKFSVASATGIVGAAGSLNNNSDPFSAIGTGFAAKRATESAASEFFRQTGASIASTSKNNFIAVGATNETKLLEIANRVMANGSIYDDKDKQKELLDEIKNALKEANVQNASTEASTIRNILRKGATSGNPYDPEQLIKSRFKGKDVPENLLKAIRNLSNYENEKIIYQAMKDSEELGKSSFSYVADVKSFITDNDYKRAKKFEYDSDDSVTQDARKEEIDTSSLDVDDMRKLEKEITKTLERERETYETQKAYDVKSDVLESEIRNLESNKLKVQLELKREYERNAGDLARQLEDIKKEISEAEANSKARNVLDKETFLREIERVASEREDEIIRAKRDLKVKATPKEAYKIGKMEMELKQFKENSVKVLNKIRDDD